MNQILRYSDLEEMLGLNRVTVWRRVKNDPTFPKPIRLGGKKTSAVGFLKSEIELWLSEQMAERHSGK